MYRQQSCSTSLVLFGKLNFHIFLRQELRILWELEAANKWKIDYGKIEDISCSLAINKSGMRKNMCYAAVLYLKYMWIDQVDMPDLLLFYGSRICQKAFV